MQIVAMAVPAQEGITRDNVTVRVDAVVYFRVVDPIKATVNVQNYMFAVSQQAQTSLRSIIGQSEMDQLLSERDTVNRELRRIIDEPTEGPWGIRVERVEIKDVSLPESMKRSMSRQAEAERERRARIITADGEYQASKRLAAAANVMARDPAALQLRLLQTVVEVAAEKNSTLVMPVPVELLRFFDKMAPGPADPEHRRPGRVEDYGDAEVAAAEAAIRASTCPSSRSRPSRRPPRWRPAVGPRGCVTATPLPIRPAPDLAATPDLARHGQGVRSVHAEVGVRDGAAARARDQADPGQLGRRRLGAGGPGARPNSEQLVAYMKRRGVMTRPSARLAALGLALPPVAAPLAAYVPAVRTGARVHAGQLPLADGKLLMTGQVGAQVSAEEAAALARTCALNALAAVASVAGGWRVIRGSSRSSASWPARPLHRPAPGHQRGQRAAARGVRRGGPARPQRGGGGGAAAGRAGRGRADRHRVLRRVVAA